MRGGPSSFIRHCNLVPQLNRHQCITVKAEAAAPDKPSSIRVCTNKTCRKQGSMQTLDVLTCISPPNISVESCGCLGRCGAGPNLVILPQGAIISHCATPARAASIMFTLAADCYGKDEDASVRSLLESLALRKRAEIEFRNSNFSQAILLLSQAIDLEPCGGTHVLLVHRAVVKLAVNDYSGSLQDAQQASALAPEYRDAFISQGDAFFAMDRLDEAEQSYSISLELDPSLCRSKPFKAKILKLQNKLTASNVAWHDRNLTDGSR